MGGGKGCPPHSPDLNPEDFYLWEYLKQQVYVIPTQALQELKQRITYACANMSRSVLKRVQRDTQTRVQTFIVVDFEKSEYLK